MKRITTGFLSPFFSIQNRRILGFQNRKTPFYLQRLIHKWCRVASQILSCFQKRNPPHSQRQPPSVVSNRFNQHKLSPTHAHPCRDVAVRMQTKYVPSILPATKLNHQEPRDTPVHSKLPLIQKKAIEIALRVKHLIFCRCFLQLSPSYHYCESRTQRVLHTKGPPFSTEAFQAIKAPKPQKGSIEILLHTPSHLLPPGKNNLFPILSPGFVF